MSYVKNIYKYLLIKLKYIYVSRVYVPCRRFMQYRHAEGGRSMLEMLGVLSIIGILTLLGLVGYQYAMIKNEANNIIDRGSKFAVLCSTYLDKNPHKSCQFVVGELNLPSGGTAEVGADVFSLTVPHVQKRVCQMVNDTSWPMLWNLLRDGLSGVPIDIDGNGCSDNMNLTMVFAHDLALEDGGNTPIRLKRHRVIRVRM